MTFITVKATQFYQGSQPYFIRGANYWQGINLAAESAHGGDRDRLHRELDQLQKMGVNNVRIMASSEGPDDQPYRMRPSLQPNLGEYNENIFQGLDYLLDAISKRNMTAVSKALLLLFNKKFIFKLIIVKKWPWVISGIGVEGNKFGLSLLDAK